MCMEPFLWLLLYVKCQHEAISQPGSKVKVLKAMLQSTGTQTGSASSSGALTGRVTVSRAVWLLIVCADKQAVRDL